MRVRSDPAIGEFSFIAESLSCKKKKTFLCANLFNLCLKLKITGTCTNTHVMWMVDFSSKKVI